jgi:hypothetical protein
MSLLDVMDQARRHRGSLHKRHVPVRPVQRGPGGVAIVDANRRPTLLRLW